MPLAFDKATGWIVNRPIASWSILALISVIAVLGYNSSGMMKAMFATKAFDNANSPSGDDIFETPPDVEPISLTDTDAILVCQSADFFSPDGVQAMRQVVERARVSAA